MEKDRGASGWPSFLQMFGPEPMISDCVFTTFRESFLHATNPVASKDLNLGHFVGHQYFLKRGRWPYHQHTC